MAGYYIVPDTQSQHVPVTKMMSWFMSGLTTHEILHDRRQPAGQRGLWCRCPSSTLISLRQWMLWGLVRDSTLTDNKSSRLWFVRDLTWFSFFHRPDSRHFMTTKLCIHTAASCALKLQMLVLHCGPLRQPGIDPQQDTRLKKTEKACKMPHGCFEIVPFCSSLTMLDKSFVLDHRSW